MSELFLWKSEHMRGRARPSGRIEGAHEDNELGGRWRFGSDAFAPADDGKGVPLECADCGDGLLLAARVREIVVGGDAVEWHPLPLRRGSKTLAERLLMNPWRVIDAIDVDASGVRWSSADPEHAMGFERGVVIDLARVPADDAPFRLKHQLRWIVVRRALALRVLSAGVTGAAFWSTTGFTGTGLDDPGLAETIALRDEASNLRK